MSDTAFDKLGLPSFEKVACSPNIDRDPGEVLRIALPARVYVRGPLPLCGTMRLGAGLMESIQPRANQAVVVVVVDLVTAEPRAFSLVRNLEPVRRPRFEPPAAPPPGVREPLATAWFNVDLRQFASELATRPGRYAAYALLRTLRSNVVQVLAVP